MVNRSGDAAQIQTLQARIKQNLGPNPPPTAEKGEPYNDPFMFQTQTDLEEQFAEIQKEEQQAKAEHDEKIDRAAHERVATPAWGIPPIVQTPPAWGIPPIVKTPPAWEIPPIVKTPPAWEIPLPIP